MARQPRKAEPEASKTGPKSKATVKPVGEARSAGGAPARRAAAKPAPKAPAGTKADAKAQSRPPAGNLLVGGMIDTGLAAAAAASLLVARRKGRDQVDDPVSIQQIKSDLNKPASAVAGELVDQHAESTGGKRPSLPDSAAPHSQTVGHAAERTYVPRRTAG